MGGACAVIVPHRRLPLQKGAALVETSLLMGVMLPVLFGLVMIGKLIDLKQTTVQAGRYAAWETTVRGAAERSDVDAQLIQSRFFHTVESAQDVDSLHAGRNRLWGSVAGGQAGTGLWADTAISVSGHDIHSHYTVEQPGQSATFTLRRATAGIGNLLDSVKGNEWGLTGAGLVSARIEAPVARNGWLGSTVFDCEGGHGVACLKTNSAILTNGWSASGDDQARRRVRSLVPASALEPVGSALSVVGKLPMFGELGGLESAFGHVDMRVLPEYANP